ncbi:MAG TPA: hypothetical protein VF975_00820 [Thermoanaerobaculia bacterium]
MTSSGAALRFRRRGPTEGWVVRRFLGFSVIGDDLERMVVVKEVMKMKMQAPVWLKALIRKLRERGLR